MARSPSRLNRKEMAVLRQEMGSFIGIGMLITFVLAGVIIGIEIALGVAPRIALSQIGLAPIVVLAFAMTQICRRLQFAAIKRVLGFDPRAEDRADGVVAEFEELRITRTEPIKGYEKDAPRIPLGGLSAKVKNTGTKTDHSDDRQVHVTIKGPDTNFVYSAAAHGAFDARISWLAGVLNRPGCATMNALQFAALLNYEASLQGAPQKKADAQEGCTKVRCHHCQHVRLVPVSQQSFVCEQCQTHLKRAAAPAKSG